MLFDPAANVGMSERIIGLYVCFQCKEIDEIPNYNPKEADKDTRIGYLVELHLRRHPSLAERMVTDWSRLGFVPESMWNNTEYRKKITKEILEGNDQKGFDAEFYATMDTFKEDAGKCYQSHGRPDYTAVGCQDYLSANKELKPNTSIERKAAGLPSYDETKIRRSFLCEHCPYHSQVISIERMKRSK